MMWKNFLDYLKRIYTEHMDDTNNETIAEGTVQEEQKVDPEVPAPQPAPTAMDRVRKMRGK